MTATVIPDAQAARPSTQWQVPPPAPPAAVERLVRELGVPPLLASILWNRGIRGDAHSYLHPPLRRTSIPDLDAAAGRLEDAIQRRRRILLHGDYDADGISGTAVLLLGLRALGADARAFIPDRLSDGYGVHPDRVEEHAAACDLFVTIDCGIGNIGEIARLVELGVEVIVSDHHHPGETLPECLIVHPGMSPSAGAGLPELTGAGVAYHLLWALHERLGLEAPVEYSDLAAIGTVADVAPLLGENRSLVQAGLAQLRQSRWPGLRASLAQSKLRRELTARDLAFVVAPRLNAAGRLGEADKALELLTTGSERRARELAAYLDARNQDRRKIQDRMLEQALAVADPHAPALVLADDAWHPGVMGIVASKVLEHFCKPVFIIAQGKGSVRSTPGISAVHSLRAAAPHLLRYGGHAQAAGFAIDSGSIAAFRNAVCEFVAGHPRPVPALLADAVVSGADVDEELFQAMRELEPFGEGLPAPLLALSDRLEVARAVGRDGATLQLRVGGLRGVAWRKGQLAGQLRAGELVNAAISVREREWKGTRELEFVAEEIRPLSPFGLSAASDRATGQAVQAGAAHIRRGPAPAGEPLDSLESEPKGELSYWFRRLPLGPEPLAATEPLRTLLAGGALVHLDLDAQALLEARRAAEQLPTVGDVRRGFVCLQRGATLPFNPAGAELVRLILTELDLLDSLGRVRRGVKRDPHSSTTMVAALIERYRLISLVNAYRALDDEAFSRAAEALLLATPGAKPAAGGANPQGGQTLERANPDREWRAAVPKPGG